MTTTKMMRMTRPATSRPLTLYRQEPHRLYLCQRLACLSYLFRLHYPRLIPMPCSLPPLQGAAVEAEAAGAAEVEEAVIGAAVVAVAVVDRFPARTDPDRVVQWEESWEGTPLRTHHQGVEQLTPRITSQLGLTNGN